jgi:hypothetical protein
MKDYLSTPSGKAMLKLKDEKALDTIIKKYIEGAVETEDVL